MALNLDLIGKRSEPVLFRFSEDDVILYALGVGAGASDLDFVYEKNLRTLPTFAAILAQTASMNLTDQMGLNMPAVLYAGQRIEFFRPIPTSGVVSTTAICRSIYDKGDKGAIINLELETRNELGEELFKNEIVLVDRSAGNFGGDRGPKTERTGPPADRKPDFQTEFVTSPNQAVLYRLCGDKNPLHLDPEFAKLAGLERPILHGLCVFGITGRAVVNGPCGCDVEKLKSFGARFTGIVFPGDKLIIEGWKMEDGRYCVQTKKEDGRVVLGAGTAEVN